VSLPERIRRPEAKNDVHIIDISRIRGNIAQGSRVVVDELVISPREATAAVVVQSLGR
jgi:hypothetical protein